MRYHYTILLIKHTKQFISKEYSTFCIHMTETTKAKAPQSCRGSLSQPLCAWELDTVCWVFTCINQWAPSTIKPSYMIDTQATNTSPGSPFLKIWSVEQHNQISWWTCFKMQIPESQLKFHESLGQTLGTCSWAHPLKDFWYKQKPENHSDTASPSRAGSATRPEADWPGLGVNPAHSCC